MKPEMLNWHGEPVEKRNCEIRSLAKPQPGSAELHSAVSQICNLRTFGKHQAQLSSQRLPIKNRRSSRLKICAAGSAQTSKQGSNEECHAKRFTYISHALGLASLTILCGCGPPATEAPKASAPVTVQTILPKRGEIARDITLPTFRVLAVQEATLYAKVSGYLKTLAVDKGDPAKEGQLLAEIEVPELLADEKQYQVEAEVARTNYQRVAEARQKAPDLVVPQTVDDLRGQWEVAQAKLQRTQTLLQYSRITAPFSGITTARFVDPGAFIPAATAGSTPQTAALVTLMDYSRVRVQAFVPETEVPFIKDGTPARVTLEELPGKTFQGSVTRFAHALDPATKTMLTEVEMPNPDGQLRPGAYAKVQLEMERKQNALLLPVQAVLVEKAGTSVFTVTDGKAKKVPVKTGFNDGVSIEIGSGINPEQPVILLGKLTLNDGQAVTVSEAK